MEEFTIALAVLGATLGVINTWWSLYKDRVRLRVRAVWGQRVKDGTGTVGMIRSTSVQTLDDNSSGFMGIEITNLGMVTVTIDGAGVVCNGFFSRRFAHRIQRRAIMGSAFNGVTFPRQLKSRESVLVWALEPSEAVDRFAAGATRVYASTACGLNIFGTSRLFRRLASGRRIRQ